MTVDHWGTGHPHLLIAEAEEQLVPLLFVHSWKETSCEVICLSSGFSFSWPFPKKGKPARQQPFTCHER